MKKDQFILSVDKLLNSGRKDPVSGISQPPFATKKRQGVEYLEYILENGINGKKYGPVYEDSGDEIIKYLSAILQPKRRFDVFVPTLCLKDFVDKVLRGHYPKNIYKGVSYNPHLLEYGEKLDNLDFFSYLCEVREFVTGESVIFDASCYHALNLIDVDWISPNVAPAICQELVRTFFLNNELRENSLLRKEYLLRMNSFSGYQMKIISMADVLTDPKKIGDFESRLTSGLAHCETSVENSRLKIRNFVKYRRIDTEFSKLYTPLVLAENLYAREILKCNVKLGPISEVSFDSFISKIQREKSGSMQFIWYTRPF